MQKMIIIVVGITIGIMTSNYFIDKNNLAQGPESRPASRAQQLDQPEEIDSIETGLAAPERFNTENEE
jgi:hypothetical protein